MNTKNIEDIYELSPMQQGLLFHTLLSPGSAEYFEQISCTVSGDLDVEAWKRAWQQVVDRHPVLRTAFYWEDLEHPLQVVQRRAELPATEEDWRGLSPTEQQARLEDFLGDDRRRGFDLATPPLMRLALLRTGERSFHFVWSHHHLLLDGWSAQQLFKEVATYYEAFNRRSSVALPVPRPYRDYINWLQQQDAARAESFWRSALKGFSAPTLIGGHNHAGNGGAPAEANAHEEEFATLSTEETTRLNSFARQHHLTLNTLAQGAWALLLAHHSGTPDVLFGATVSGRPAQLAGVEQMVGLFINALPVRAQVDWEAEVVGWLRRLQEQGAEARQYEYAPLSEVQRWSEVTRGQSMFESLFVFENYPLSGLEEHRSDIEIKNVRSFEQTNYPLTVVAWGGRELGVRVEYDPQRFARDTVRRLISHFQTLLVALAADPARKLSELPILTGAEHRQLMAWNETRAEYPKVSVHQLFEQQAGRTPDAIALISEDEELSYAALNARANQLAHHLRTLGVGTDSLVGVMMERSTELVVALLGILKAGGAYVPLDPSYPQERLSFMLKDARVSVLLTQERLREQMPDYTGHVICLDAEPETLARAEESNPLVDTAPESLAYVIYTSGSTGTPKGVCITHRGLVNYLTWAITAYRVAEGSGSLVHSPVGFDLTVTSLFTPLLSGRRVTLLPEAETVEALSRALLAGSDLSLLKLTPAHLDVLAQLLPPTEVGGRVRALVIGGEALHGESLRFWQEHAPRTRLINEYGPTETVVGCCVYEAAEGEAQKGDVPIGRPIANTQLYILDSRMQPVPTGVSGELYIAGEGLARGYLGRPGVTAERFVPNSFGRVVGARMYRTGDLARYRADGRIEFLGRNDEQVKIRGYRIELGEIEAALRQHEALEEALVVARAAGAAAKRLVAYVVPKEERKLSVSELRGFLREKLPEYMLPSSFVTLKALPLTPNGKVDRHALPDPEGERPELDVLYVRPRDEAERFIAGIWQEVLRLDRVGVNDNFFDLGGHSLLVFQVHAKLRQRFRQDLTIVELFRHTTIGALARFLSEERGAEDGAAAQKLQERVAKQKEALRRHRHTTERRKGTHE
jgi:amino acid adenylation domain-containing protein